MTETSGTEEFLSCMVATALLVVAATVLVTAGLLTIIAKATGRQGYEVYQASTGHKEAVKVGFSWPAFFFAPFWLILKQLWLIAAVWWCLLLVLMAMESVTDAAHTEPELQGMMNVVLGLGWLAMAVVPGLMGNRWYRAALLRKGYRLLRKVEATGQQAALSRVDGAATGTG